MKKMLTIKVLVLFLISAGILAIAAWAFYQSTLSTDSSEAPDQDKKTHEEVNDRCPEGFNLYETETFHICYPIDMTKQATNSSDISYFSSEKEDLTVGFEENKKWPIHLCNIEKKTTVASRSAIKTTFKRESIAGCGRSYRYVTIVETEDVPFAIDLNKKEGTYETGMRYEKIEKSLYFLP